MNFLCCPYAFLSLAEHPPRKRQKTRHSKRVHTVPGIQSDQWCQNYNFLGGECGEGTGWETGRLGCCKDKCSAWANMNCVAVNYVTVTVILNLYLAGTLTSLFWFMMGNSKQMTNSVGTVSRVQCTFRDSWECLNFHFFLAWNERRHTTVYKIG